VNEQTKEDTEKAQEKTKPRTEQTQKDHEKAQGKGRKRSPHSILSKSHKDHPDYKDSDAYARSLRAPEEAPEDFGGAGGVGGEDTGGLSGSSTIGEREEAAGLTNTMSGRVDPFYIFDRPISSEEITDQGVHDAGGGVGVPVPAPVSSFNATICVNGKPFSAAIQGIVGDEIT
tara:strand:- start:2289 stop:2807 length:519 start_codon:yes stop_codon:yes gene_type:complete